MKTKLARFLGRALRSENAQMLPMMAVMMIGFLGMAAIVIDMGDIYYSYHELRASTDAAAMAAAEALPTSGALALQYAQEYSSHAGSASMAAGKNAFGNLNVTSFSAELGCVTTGAGSSTPCASTGLANGVQEANAVQVKQTARVRLYFAALFGHPYVDITATGSALMRGSAAPYNIALILDATGSMNDPDSNCGMTQLNCALTGVRTFLANVAPCGSTGCVGTGSNSSNYDNAYDRVALFTFPNGQLGAMSNDYNCSGLPADEISPVRGQGSLQNGIPYVFPPIGGGSGPINYNVTTTTRNWNGQTTTTTTTYQVTGQVTNGLGDSNGFMSNYQGDSGLNIGSDLVTTLGGKSGCSSIAAPYANGTYYAGVIYQAQAALAAEQAANPKSQNVMIILGDGDMNIGQDSNGQSVIYYEGQVISDPQATVMTSSQTNGLVPSSSPLEANNYYPSRINDCGQAILAAQYAKEQGTTIYTVAYGSSINGASSGSSDKGCLTDTSGIPLGTDGVTGQSTGLSGTSKGISPCTTMKYMASSDATFYSDYQASGGSHQCQGTATGQFTDLASIFKAIAGGLSVARLIPDSAFPAS